MELTDGVKLRTKNQLKHGVYDIVHLCLKNDSIKENTVTIKDSDGQIFLIFNDDNIDSREYKYMGVKEYKFGKISSYHDTYGDAVTTIG
jgi:hypothetical protein